MLGKTELTKACCRAFPPLLVQLRSVVYNASGTANVTSQHLLWNKQQIVSRLHFISRGCLARDQNAAGVRISAIILAPVPVSCNPKAPEKYPCMGNSEVMTLQAAHCFFCLFVITLFIYLSINYSSSVVFSPVQQFSVAQCLASPSPLCAVHLCVPYMPPVLPSVCVLFLLRCAVYTLQSNQMYADHRNLHVLLFEASQQSSLLFSSCLTVTLIALSSQSVGVQELAASWHSCWRHTLESIFCHDVQNKHLLQCSCLSSACSCYYFCLQFNKFS